jgi:hypothetical protein
MLALVSMILKLKLLAYVNKMAQTLQQHYGLVKKALAMSLQTCIHAA